MLSCSSAACYTSELHNLVKQLQKHITAGIRWWSPTQLLICRSEAYVWQSGRDAQISSVCGRMYSPTLLVYISKINKQNLRLLFPSFILCKWVALSSLEVQPDEVCQPSQFQKETIFRDFIIAKQVTSADCVYKPYGTTHKLIEKNVRTGMKSVGESSRSKSYHSTASTSRKFEQLSTIQIEYPDAPSKVGRRGFILELCS